MLFDPQVRRFNICICTVEEVFRDQVGDYTPITEIDIRDLPPAVHVGDTLRWHVSTERLSFPQETTIKRITPYPDDPTLKRVLLADPSHYPEKGTTVTVNYKESLIANLNGSDEVLNFFENNKTVKTLQDLTEALTDMQSECWDEAAAETLKQIVENLKRR